MNKRLLGGAVAALLYNHAISHVPSRLMRRTWLGIWLGSLGEGTSVQMGVRFLNGRKVHLGRRNVLNFCSLLDGRRYRIQTGDDVSIGPEATILTLGHDPHSPEFADRGGDVLIGDHVWIGYRALILPGITIGDGAVVGAGAVVTKSVDAYSIVAGNPARMIAQRDRKLCYQLRHNPPLQ